MRELIHMVVHRDGRVRTRMMLAVRVCIRIQLVEALLIPLVPQSFLSTQQEVPVGTTIRIQEQSMTGCMNMVLTSHPDLPLLMIRIHTVYPARLPVFLRMDIHKATRVL